ncbi:Cysteine-rich receptor-like protein kinase 10 [Hordeum vulgare]|nr:Cysteine-rich receptor-like protein kinase 10 [Hordeum vulgare]
MESTTSSSSGSCFRSSGSSGVAPHQAGAIGDEPRASSSRLVRPKTEPGLLPVKQEHFAMVVDDEAALKWAQDDYVREEMERQRRAPEETAARRRGREEGVAVILDERDEEAPTPAHLGDPNQGSNKDGAPADGNDDDDYTAFYKLLGM